MQTNVALKWQAVCVCVCQCGGGGANGSLSPNPLSVKSVNRDPSCARVQPKS